MLQSLSKNKVRKTNKFILIGYNYYALFGDPILHLLSSIWSLLLI